MTAGDGRWRLEGHSVIAGKTYPLGGAHGQPLAPHEDWPSYPNRVEALHAAHGRLENLERTQPAAVSGGQAGVQDRVHIVHPDGRRERVPGTAEPAGWNARVLAWLAVSGPATMDDIGRVHGITRGRARQVLRDAEAAGRVRRERHSPGKRYPEKWHVTDRYTNIMKENLMAEPGPAAAAMAAALACRDAFPVAGDVTPTADGGTFEVVVAGVTVTITAAVAAGPDGGRHRRSGLRRGPGVVQSGTAGRDAFICGGDATIVRGG